MAQWIKDPLLSLLWHRFDLEILFTVGTAKKEKSILFQCGESTSSFFFFFHKQPPLSQKYFLQVFYCTVNQLDSCIYSHYDLASH